LATEFAIDAIVDVIDPAAEVLCITENRICKWLELYIVVKRCTAVFTRKNVFQEFEPFFDRGFVFYWICGN